MNILTLFTVYLKVTKSVNPKSSHHKGKAFSPHHFLKKLYEVTKLTTVIISQYMYSNSLCYMP